MTNQEWAEQRLQFLDEGADPRRGRGLACGQHNLSAGSWRLLEGVLEEMQAAEEIWGPGEDEYAPLMVAIASEAQLRLAGFIANLREREKTQG